MERICTSCGEAKEETSGFYRNGGKRKGYNAICKICRFKQQQVYYNKHKEEYLIRTRKYRSERLEHYKITQRNLNLRKEYGLTREDYNKMFEDQKGRCAICQKEWHKTLLVDHDHKTRRVRGLLCRKCNTGLGQFCDDPNILWDATLYLERNSNNYI